MVEQINTVREIIERLGGISEVARLFGFNPSQVGNWYARGFPPETYIVITAELAKRNLTAPPSLWKMHEPSDAATASQ